MLLLLLVVVGVNVGGLAVRFVFRVSGCVLPLARYVRVRVRGDLLGPVFVRDFPIVKADVAAKDVGRSANVAEEADSV